MKKVVLASVAIYALALSFDIAAQQPTGDGPQYKGNALVKPANYREWIFLSSGVGMTYQPAGRENPNPAFTNVFVNPTAYRRFMQTGTWPDKTVMILEVRASASEGSINKGGRYQTDGRGMEAHVKDS